MSSPSGQANEVQFHTQDFDTRFSSMGDEAEAMFEQTYEYGWVRYGLSRPPLKMSMLSTVVRHTPDYLTSRGFVEVQGFGKDQIVKLKPAKLDALGQWDSFMPVELFLWDSTNSRYGQWPLDVVLGWLDHPDATTGEFHDTGMYHAIPASVMFP